MKHTRAAMFATVAFGLVAVATAGHAADVRSPEPQAPIAQRSGTLATLTSGALPKDGVRHPPSWQATVLPRIADNRPTGRADWDVDYPSQLAPQPQR